MSSVTEERKRALEEKKKKLAELKAKRQSVQEQAEAIAEKEKELAKPNAEQQALMRPLQETLDACLEKEKMHLSTISEIRKKMKALEEDLAKEEAAYAALAPRISDLRSQLNKVCPSNSNAPSPAFTSPSSSSSSSTYTADLLPSQRRGVVAGELSYRPRLPDLALHHGMMKREVFDDQMIAYLIWDLDERMKQVVIQHKEMITWKRGVEEDKQTKEWQVYTWTKLVTSLSTRKTPCFVTCDYRYITADGRVSSKPIYIKWIPSGTSLSIARLYGTLTNTLMSKHYFNISKVIEAEVGSELEPSYIQ
eukprot:gb/GEZN01013172.1/.p1 GENE.gb/GEZN01013172.1/~~gb/GEZN01013172.1/.p1  ORF type:complete len:307 (+),score=70.68 gb/GEZN01013172.1/:39-959(+)